MLNRIIQFSLCNRLLIVSISLVVMVVGSVVTVDLPIDVLPDLTRPRVTVITECHGYAPEEVERLVTFPLESAINGANGVMAVRSSSGIGLSLINVEFDWGTDVYIATKSSRSEWRRFPSNCRTKSNHSSVPFRRCSGKSC